MNVLEKISRQEAILGVLLRKNEQYQSFKIFSQKIAEGKFKVNAEELGFKFGEISLGAWLDKFYGDMQKDGLVKIDVITGKGFPKGWIIITEKGKQLFLAAQEELFKIEKSEEAKSNSAQ